MIAEELINDKNFEIIEFKKYHWIFYQKEDHIDVYEIREGDVIGGFYAPEVPFTLEDIVNKLSDKSEDEVYDFVHTYIEYDKDISLRKY